MTDRTELPGVFTELGYVPDQYGLAESLTALPEYAVLPFDRAFNGFQSLVSYFAGLTSDQLDAFDVTAYYSRRWPDLNEGQQADLEAHDIRAYAAAVGTTRLVAYGRGHVIDTENTGVGPYAGLDFTPTCMSFCFWPTRADARVGAAHPDHGAAVRKASEWFERSGIVKLKPDFRSAAGGVAMALTFRPVRVITLSH